MPDHLDKLQQIELEKHRAERSMQAYEKASHITNSSVYSESEKSPYRKLVAEIEADARSNPTLADALERRKMREESNRILEEHRHRLATDKKYRKQRDKEEKKRYKQAMKEYVKNLKPDTYASG